MNAQLPNRIYISLKPSTMATVAKLASAMGKPRATVLSDMIEENAEVLAQLADAVYIARQAEDAAKGLWRSDVAHAAKVAERLQDQAHELVANLSDKATDGRAARPRAAGASAHVGGRS